MTQLHPISLVSRRWIQGLPAAGIWSSDAWKSRLCRWKSFASTRHAKRNTLWRKPMARTLLLASLPENRCVGRHQRRARRLLCIELLFWYFPGSCKDLNLFVSCGCGPSNAFALFLRSLRGNVFKRRDCLLASSLQAAVQDFFSHRVSRGQPFDRERFRLDFDATRVFTLMQDHELMGEAKCGVSPQTEVPTGFSWEASTDQDLCLDTYQHNSRAIETWQSAAWAE